MAEKQIKIGVNRGGGPPPGYRWTVLVLEVAHKEAKGFLNEDQYEHLVMQLRDLAREADPTHSRTQSIDAVEDYHELRDKGGILGGMNVRVFFMLDKNQSSLVVLGAIKKQNDGPTLNREKIRIRHRMRKYQRGEFR